MCKHTNMLIEKEGQTFNVSGVYSERWFSQSNFNKWEPETFCILNHYQNKDGVYIDVGSWIGPTVMYASSLFKRVMAMEPDRIALYRLKQNLSVNEYKNITIIDKCLSRENGTIDFGGNGKWGNSESTMLVSDNDYSSWGGRWDKDARENNVKTVNTITMDKMLEDEDINPTDISLIKMDIEGGELIVIPHLQHFLRQHKPIFYISLHYCFLKLEHIIMILDILFNIYGTCYVFDVTGTKQEVTKEVVLTLKLKSLVFE
jgi:FkbM family methyltransferase